jgi:hypothetical protein
MDDESYLSIFAVDGVLAAAAPKGKPPPWIPQGPRSLSSASLEPVQPSIYVIGKGRKGKLVRTSLVFHNLSKKRALRLADALEAAAEKLRDPANHDRVFDMDDPGVSVDVSTALNSAD